MISSLNNRIVRSAAKLKKPRERQRRGAILVEGRRAVAVALQSGATVTALLHLPRARARVGLMDAAGAAGAKVSEVAEQVMAHLTHADHPADVLGVVLRRPDSLSSAVAGSFLVILDRVSDPAVAGGIMAAAAAAGATGVVATAGAVDLLTPACIRAAAGAHFALPFAVDASAKQVASMLGEKRLVALESKGLPVCSAAMKRPIAVVIAQRNPSEGLENARRVSAGEGSWGISAGLAAQAAIVLHEVSHSETR